MNSDSDLELFDEPGTPPNITESANNATLELLPQTSKEIYENCYKRFMNWRMEQYISSFSENVIIAYFAYLSTKIKPSTLWGHYSMLKATLNVKNNINIKNYNKLIPYLKRKSDGYRPKKTLTKEQIDRFLVEAPDVKYLMTKIVLIFGVAGALRRDELSKIKLDDIHDLGSALLINIPNTKTKKPKSFTVAGESYLEFYRKYFALRPPNMNESRFFIKYQNGKCHRHVVGIHKLAPTAQEVAAYLNLPDLKCYTGHCLRRTLATLLVNARADITALKRHGGWQSSAIAESYIDDSITNKLETSNKILDTNPSTSKSSNDKHTCVSNANIIVENNQPSSSCAPINFNN